MSCSGDSLAAQPYQRFPEVHPRFARPMHQRDEHFLAALVKLAHRLLHRSVAACVASFPQPLPHTFGRVLLLAGQVAIRRHDLLQPFPIRPDLGLRTGLRLAIPRRFAVGENLLERAPVHPRFPENLPATDTSTSTRRQISVHCFMLRYILPFYQDAALFNRPLQGVARNAKLPP